MTFANALLLSFALLAVGCAAPAVAEEEGETSSHIESSAPECGGSRKNAACDTKLFIENAIDLQNEDPSEGIVAHALEAKDCITSLVALGAVGASTGGLADLAIISSEAVHEGMTAIVACYNTVTYLNEIGLFDNISCVIEPNRNSADVNTCECTQMCKRGVDVTSADGESIESKKFKYGFISPGATQCNCTNDTKAVACGSTCADWASSDPKDCTCNTP